MPERFERLYQLPANLYSENAPVIVVAGALLKDSVSDSIIVQIKYKSVSDMLIKALKIDVKAFDVSGQQLQGVEDYQYLDLNIQNGMEFGSKKAIVMPVAVTRSFLIGKITVVFADGSTWVSAAEMTALPEAKSLQSVMENYELLKQYRLATNATAIYVPVEGMNLWMCTCGEWNSISKCCACGCERSTVFGSLEIEALAEKMEIRLAAEKEQREEQERLLEIARQEQAERDKIVAEEVERQKAQKKKRKCVAMIATPILLLLILVFSLSLPLQPFLSILW